MEKKTKHLLLYVFMLTLFPQLVMIFAVWSVGSWAWWFTTLQSGLIGLLGAAGFLAMLFLFLSVSVAHDDYAVSMWSKGRVGFVSPDAPMLTRIDITVGRANTFTGRRPIYVRERKIGGAGVLFFLAVKGLVLTLIGGVEWIVESLRVLKNESRRDTWEACWIHMQNKKDKEGSWENFFRFPAVMFAALLVLWALILPTSLVVKAQQSPDNLQFTITQKVNADVNLYTAWTHYEGTLVNNGPLAVQWVEGTVYVRNRDGKLLSSFKTNIRNSRGALLEKGQSWELDLACQMGLDDPLTVELWNTATEDLQITMDVIEIRFEGDKFIEYPGEDLLVLKPLGE